MITAENVSAITTLDFSIDLGRSDEMVEPAVPDGEINVRVVSTDGRRSDRLARTRMDKAGHQWLDFDAPAAFFSSSLYMIEVDSGGPHPLGLQRFVFEVR